MRDEVKARLCNYIKLKKRIENHEERIARMRSDEQFPAMRPSDGSKRNPGASDRMGNAVIRRIEYEERMADSIKDALAEMSLIEAAVFSLDDPLECEVLQLRYIDGDINGAARPMHWSDVAIKIYGDDDEKDVRNAHRLHGRALQSIRQGGLL